MSFGYPCVHHSALAEQHPAIAELPSRFFGAGHLRYDPEKYLYICPANEHLHRHARISGDRGTRYRATAQACNSCELKKRCTDSENGRTIYRRPDEDYYERVRAYRRSFPYEKALRKR